MTKTRLIAAFILASVSFNVQSQVNFTDSEGKDIFNFYQTKSYNFTLNPAAKEFKGAYTAALSKGKQFWIPASESDTIIGSDDAEGVFRYRPIDSTKFTVAKSWGLTTALKIGGVTNVASNSSKFRPTYGVAATVSNNIDVFNRWENIKRLKQPFFKTFGLTVFANRDNSEVYDTVQKLPSREHPISYGLTGEITIFSTKISPDVNFAIGLHLAATIERGWNTADLKNYQQNLPNYIDPNVISLGDIVGRVGDLQRQNNVRLRTALPLFPGTFKLPWTTGTQVQTMIMPYYVFFGKIDTQLNRQAGFLVNFSHKSIHVKDATLVSGLGVGLDWSRKDNKWSGHNLFFVGTLNIHEFFPHKKPKPGR